VVVGEAPADLSSGRERRLERDVLQGDDSGERRSAADFNDPPSVTKKL
jgi:hypothetical protein